ncbi:type II toxin-antitoxin system VapC family toxin [Leifsonia sp. NPDC077715]|uniref:type II toxin-antitoxin system VapC family toxin n=1 Tax=Leifsonia sp. NPDC077715 TaxID=3155539 RepID=UPI003438D966
MVTVAYLDTSAAMKLVLQEAESDALAYELVNGERRLASSWLLHTEMHCAAGRRPDVVDLETISTVLRRITLVDLTRGDLLAAGGHPPLRSNDAVHLATALRIGADEMVTYDDELARAAERFGLVVVAPA